MHCKAGKSRSVTVVLGYLIHANAWTLKASYAYVAERRRGISPNIGFVAELMQYEESELGLKGSTGISTSPDRHTVDNADYEKDSVTRRNGHARESLPPAWGSQNASSADADESVTTPRPLESSHRTELPSRADLAGGGDHRGMNKEVRKNGQYVHSRRYAKVASVCSQDAHLMSHIELLSINIRFSRSGECQKPVSKGFLSLRLLN